MLLIKDDTLAVMTRAFSVGKQNILAVSVLAGFALESPSSLFHEEEIWETAASALDKSQILDQGLPKPGGEVLIAGRCFAPKNTFISACEASLRLGGLRKSLYVFGNRRWEQPLYGVKAISTPEPFARLDLTWEHAFGGPDFPLNPLGKGLSPVMSPDGRSYVPLPNIEDPGHLISSSWDHPHPAGFAPRGLDWPSLLKHIGTFDDKWLQDSWPGFPEDFNFAYFNLAPKDQQIDGYFRGDEPIELAALHPEHEILHSRLPGLRPRVFADVRTEKGNEFREIKTRLDTVWLFPHLNMGLCIWRGTIRVKDDEAEEIARLLAFYEKLAEEAKPLTHYQALMEKPPAEEPTEPAEKKEVTAEPPQPPEEKPALAEPEDQDQVLAKILAPIRKTIAENEAQLDNYLRGMGIDPNQTPVSPRIEEISSLKSPSSELPKNLKPEDLLRHVTAQRESAEKQLEEHLEKLGLVFGAEPPTVPAPETSIDEVIGALESLPGDHGELIGAIQGLAAELRQRQENIAGLKKAAEAARPKEEPALPLEEPEAPPKTEVEPAALTRKDILEGYAQGLSFSGKDLIGLDLSEAELPGIDLSGANLENVNLTRADLTGADLKNAILSGADLTGARLAQADLSRVSADSAKLAEADLKEAKLHLANLRGANLSQADLRGADLRAAVFSKAVLARADCRGVKARGADFTSSDLRGTPFHEADLAEADLSDAKMHQTNFSRANLSQAALAEAKGEGCVFEEANLQGAKADGKTIFHKGNFRGADLSKAYFEDTDFSSANFEDAVLTGASLTRCRLKGASLYRAKGRWADFSKSNLENADMRLINLFNGSLRKARLTGTNLRGSNLSGVDFYKSIHHDTKFEGANLNRTLLTVWRKK